MKAEIKAWLDVSLSGHEIDAIEYGIGLNRVSEIIEECMADIGPKLEWTLMADKEPAGEYDYIECYITLKSAPKCVEEYPWNTHHKCFDDKDYDDHAHSAEEVLYWLKKPDVDLPDLPNQKD